MEETVVKDIKEEILEKQIELNKEIDNATDKASVNEDISNGFRYLLFELDSEQYGVNIEYVMEIIGLQDITQVPKTPKFIKGLINLRGKIIPLIDGRLKLNKPSKEYNDRTCIIVLEVNEIIVGLVVDSISDVITLRESDMEHSPKIGKIKANKYIKEIAKVGKEVKLLIDCEKFINE